jgi:hypothetical protein
MKDVQATGEAFCPQKENIEHSKHFKQFLHIIYFVGRVCPPGSGYQCGSGTKLLDTIQNVTIHYRKIYYPVKP